MSTIVRLYLGWRTLRLLRRLLAAGLIIGIVLALPVGHARVKRSAAVTLQRGAAAAAHNLSRALERGLAPRPPLP